MSNIKRKLTLNSLILGKENLLTRSCRAVLGSTTHTSSPLTVPTTYRSKAFSIVTKFIKDHYCRRKKHYERIYCTAWKTNEHEQVDRTPVLCSINPVWVGVGGGVEN
jgi:hypothetical protein